MKYAIALLATATPALAHPGAHLHPHVEGHSHLPLVAGAAALGLAAVLLVRKLRQ